VSSALDMQRERARFLAREMVGRAPGGSIACIFAGGSLGRGEVWAAEFDGALDVYSDIDLYVVAARDDAVPGLRGAAQSLRMLPDPPGVRFLRRADIGVYTRADLEAQPVRPGTAELDAHHLMLHGDETIPRALHGRGAAMIPAEEALYLLENRVVELVDTREAAEDPATARLVQARALKAWLDVYAAHAIVDGSFAALLHERAARFRREPPATLDESARRQIAGAFAATDDIGAWIRAHPAARDGALDTLVSSWRALAPRVLDLDASPARLVARRCRAGSFLRNARDVFRLRHRFAQPAARVAMAALRLGRLSPVDALRVDALARCLASEPGRDDAFNGHFAYVRRLTEQFGFNDRSLEDNVRRMYEVVA
jgi:hypothetical protein